jgi:hypothetical protein
MKTVFILALAAFACACATYRDPALDAYPQAVKKRQREEVRREEHQDAVRRMQDEFSAAFPDS